MPSGTPTPAPPKPWQCAGICTPEARLEPIYKACLKDPLNNREGLGVGIADWDEGLNIPGRAKK